MIELYGADYIVPWQQAAMKIRRRTKPTVRKHWRGYCRNHGIAPKAADGSTGPVSIGNIMRSSPIFAPSRFEQPQPPETNDQ